jgi:hypothetical protein
MNYYKITEIDFDFDGEDITQEEIDTIVTETKGCLWTSPTEEDLSDIIANNTGWCINSLSYDVIAA